MSHDFKASFAFTVILKPGFSTFTVESTPPWIGFFVMGPKCQNPNLSLPCNSTIKNYIPFGVIAEISLGVWAGGR